MHPTGIVDADREGSTQGVKIMLTEIGPPCPHLDGRPSTIIGVVDRNWVEFDVEFNVCRKSRGRVSAVASQGRSNTIVLIVEDKLRTTTELKARVRIKSLQLHRPGVHIIA